MNITSFIDVTLLIPSQENKAEEARRWRRRELQRSRSAALWLKGRRRSCFSSDSVTHESRRSSQETRRSLEQSGDPLKAARFTSNISSPRSPPRCCCAQMFTVRDVTVTAAGSAHPARALPRPEASQRHLPAAGESSRLLQENSVRVVLLHRSEGSSGK